MKALICRNALMVARLQHRPVMTSALLSQKTASDPVQQLFVEKIREYSKKQKSAGGLFVDSTPEVEKSYKDELDRIARVFSIQGDPTKFPEFKFDEPKLDPIFLHSAEEQAKQLQQKK